MNKKSDQGEAPPPDSVDGWRAAAAGASGFGVFRMEDIVRAVQDPTLKADRQTCNALMGHISRVLFVELRKRVSTGWKNRGQDLIDDIHDTLIDAILRPSSADGTELGRRFWAVLNSRMIDAIRAEEKNQDRYIPSEIAFTGAPSHDGEDERNQVEADLAIERLLECVPDLRKRLAYRLHLKGIPSKSNKGTISISRAMGVSDKTARQWIDEVDALVQEKIGDRNDQ